MPRYIYNNIIVVTNNVIVLEFLPALFPYASALLPFYLFYHELEHKNDQS